MKEQVIPEIIAKVLSHEATAKEEDMLNLWLAESAENREKYELLKKAWQTPETRYQPKEIINHEHVKERVWQRTMGRSGSGRNLNTRFLIKVAASVLIIASLAWGVWFGLSTNNESVPVKIVVKENPSGQKSKIYLPDGTTVWLNSSSRLSFFSEFTDTLRHLRLEGEAYFQVAKDHRRPFVVEAGDVSVTALGTEFNVKAYDDQDLNVSLLEGKVQVAVKDSGEGETLYPGECTSYSGNGENLIKQSFDPAKVTGWKDGVLYFEDAQLPKIIGQLELWYGVTIDNQISKPIFKHFNGRFDNESLENVLDNVSFAFGFDYKINGNRVIIK